MSSSFDKYVYLVKGELPPCLREKPCALRNSLVTHANLNPRLTGWNWNILPSALHLTPYVFTVNGFKTSIHYPGIVLYGPWAYEESRPHAAQHRWFQLLYNTQREAANPQTCTTRSGFLMTSPFYCQKQHKLCRTQGSGERHFTRLISLSHQTQEVSATRGSGSPLMNFGVELQQFGHSFWLYVTLNYCIITFWEFELQWTFIGAGGSHPAEEINKNTEKQAKHRGPVVPGCLHHRSANYNNLMLPRL